MSEFTQGTGYFRATQAPIPAAEWARGTQPWAKGDLSALLRDTLKGNAPAPAGHRTAPAELKTREASTPPEAESSDPAENREFESQEPRAPEADREQTLAQTAGPDKPEAQFAPSALIPPAYAPVIAPGLLRAALNRQAGPEQEQQPEMTPDMLAFQLGKGGAAGAAFRARQAALEEAVTGDGNDSSKSADQALEQYALFQQQEFMRSMDSFVAQEKERLQQQASLHETRIAELDADIRRVRGEKEATETALAENAKDIERKDTEIAQIQSDISQVKTDIEGLEDKKRETNRAAAAQEQAIAATGESIAKAEEAARKATEAGHENRDISNRLEGAVDIYADNVKLQEEKIRKLNEEIKAAEEKQLKDENGNAVYKDKNGKFYQKAPDGSRQDYSDEEQLQLKEKQEAGGLISADEIEEKRLQLAEEEKLREGMQRGVETAEDKKREFAAQADEKFSEADAFKAIADSLRTEQTAQTESLSDLEKENQDLTNQIQQKKQQLAELEEQLKTAKEGKAELLRKQAQLQEDLKQQEKQLKDLEGMRAEEERQLMALQEDMASLEKYEEKRKDPEMQKRLNSGDPAVREAAQKELMETMSPRLQQKFQEQREKQLSQEAVAENSVQQQPEAALPEPIAAAPAPTENTSRALGTAAAELEGSSGGQTSLQFQAAASGATATPATSPEPEVRPSLAANQQRQPASLAYG